METNQLKIIENTPIIETERLLLRKYTYEDTEAILDILSDEEVNIFLPWFPVKTREGAEEHLLKNYLSYYKKPSAYRYAICLKSSNTPIGYVVVGEAESYDFGYGLRKEFWHQGIMSEASIAVADRLRLAGYEYITATHDIKNGRSGEVMKKIGMTYRYSYKEQWQPKDILVTFKMYQLNFDNKDERIYKGYC